MIYVGYLALAALVVFLSNQAGKYVDLLDKKTGLSGAFIGGVMLSAVTSLPELFTSLTATVFLNQPELCMGNILGSNLFNLAALSGIILAFFLPFAKGMVGKSHLKTAGFVMLIYLVLMLNRFTPMHLAIGGINMISFAIIIIYILGIKFMASDDSAQNEEEDTCPLTTRQVVVRFILVSIGLVGVSIGMTYATDIIAEKLGLGAGLAGALLLGVATSLPELASTIALFRIKNYNVAFGNIIGSNLFNFIIFSLADIVYYKASVYDFPDKTAENLLWMGAIATPLFFVMTKWKNKVTQIICPVLIIGLYVLSLTYQ